MPFTTFLNIILRKCLSKHRNERTIARQIYRALVLYRLAIPLICLLNCHLEPDKRLSRSGHSRNKTDTLFLFLFALLNDIQNKGDRSIRRNLIGLMPRYVLHGMIFI